MGLQYGVPPEVYVSKLTHMRFEPSGGELCHCAIEPQCGAGATRC